MFCFFAFLPVFCGTRHTFYSELRVDFIHAAAHPDRPSLVACRILNRWSFVWRKRLTVFMSSCCLANPGQLSTRPAELRVPPVDQHVYKFECEVRLHVPSFVVGEHVLNSRDCRDGTEHRGNPNCTRSDDLTRNYRGMSSQRIHP